MYNRKINYSRDVGALGCKAAQGTRAKIVTIKLQNSNNKTKCAAPMLNIHFSLRESILNRKMHYYRCMGGQKRKEAHGSWGTGDFGPEVCY